MRRGGPRCGRDAAEMRPRCGGFGWARHHRTLVISSNVNMYRYITSHTLMKAAFDVPARNRAFKWALTAPARPCGSAGDKGRMHAVVQSNPAPRHAADLAGRVETPTPS